MTLIDGKLILKPITVESGMNDVGQCIGSSSTDWGTLCTPVKNGTSSNINGMSEKKPIHNPSNGELADADFRGTPTSIGEGKIYGMQVGCPSNNPYYIHIRRGVLVFLLIGLWTSITITRRLSLLCTEITSLMGKRLTLQVIQPYCR